jgi:phage terminase small subunit
LTENKSRFKPHEALAEETSTTEVEEVSEEEEIEIMDIEEVTVIETIEDLEEILVTDQKDVSTAKNKDILLGIVNNVSLIINVARKPREFNRDRNDRDRGNNRYNDRRSRSRSGDRHKKHNRRRDSSGSRSD